MTDNELRKIISDFLNGCVKKEEIASLFYLQKCCVCGYYDFQELMSETEDGFYCDTCNKSRDL